MLKNKNWNKGQIPISVLMISLNEEHNLNEVLDNLEGWANEVFLVDSYSNDRTIDIALSRGINIVQRKFASFGDQWNYAASELPISNPWVMKIDPDERLSDELKKSIGNSIKNNDANGFEFYRRLWFMGKPLSIRQKILRVWRNGECKFSNVSVNEHPIVNGEIEFILGDLEHHDSPNLHHWFDKQNQYSTAESISVFNNENLSVEPNIFGNSLEKRMWLKKIYSKVPFRHQVYFIYCFIVLGAIRSGYLGLIWARLRVQVFRMREYKLIEMNWTDSVYTIHHKQDLIPDNRVKQIKDN